MSSEGESWLKMKQAGFNLTYMRAPKDHQSTALPWPLRVRISGAMYSIVPQNLEEPRDILESHHDKEKSGNSRNRDIGNFSVKWALVVAQRIEHRPTNLEVVGSNPARYWAFLLSEFQSWAWKVSLSKYLKEVHRYSWWKQNCEYKLVKTFPVKHLNRMFRLLTSSSTTVLSTQARETAGCPGCKKTSTNLT